MSKYKHLRVVGEEYEPTVEEQLAASKKFNKATVVLIIIMIVMMSIMIMRMDQWATEYQGLEERYEKLYEDLKGVQ